MEIVTTTICWAIVSSAISPVWIIPPHRLAGGVLEVIREGEQEGIRTIRNVSVVAVHRLGEVSANGLSGGELHDGDESSLAIATTVVRCACTAIARLSITQRPITIRDAPLSLGPQEPEALTEAKESPGPERHAPRQNCGWEGGE